MSNKLDSKLRNTLVNNSISDATTQYSILRALMSIDERLEEQNNIQQEMLNNWGAYRNVENNR